MLHLLPLVSVSRARLVNVTIDDTYGDARTGRKPQYASQNVPWFSATPSQMGSIPNWTDVHNSTLYSLHDTGASQPRPTISLTFEGTVIYAFFVVTPWSSSSLTFFLDDEPGPADHFTLDAGAAPDYLYNQLLFKSRQLPQREHTLRVSVDPPTSASGTYKD
ncbi:hypothetical protein AURDEDRAFT_164372 [Auricularia subglabra TFB-10046 SS5]|nr:hypothetical protein AURDEDRAFT_164372 [Auricularia subglabra TFB-10046 SS5]